MRDDAVGFHRRRSITRIGIRKLEHTIGRGEGGLRVTVSEAAPADDVRSRFRMQQRRAAGHRALQIGDGGERVVVNADQIAGIFRDITRVGDDDRDRLADIAHAVDGNRKINDRRLNDGRDRTNQIGEIVAGNDGAHAGQHQCTRDIDASNIRMRMR